MDKNLLGDRPHPGTVPEEKILRRIPLEILLCSAILAAGAAVFFSLLTALFVLAGGALSAAAFLWLHRTLAGVLTRGRKRALRSGILLYLSRLVLIIAVFSIIILIFPGKVLAFAAGFSTVIPVFLAEAATALARMRRWKS